MPASSSFPEIARHYETPNHSDEIASERFHEIIKLMGGLEPYQQEVILEELEKIFGVK